VNHAKISIYSPLRFRVASAKQSGAGVNKLIFRQSSNILFMIQITQIFFIYFYRYY